MRRAASTRRRFYALASLPWPRFLRAGASARAPRRGAARRAASGRPGAHPMAFRGQCACGAKRSAHSALPCRGSPREGAVGKGRGGRAWWLPRRRSGLAPVATPPPLAGHKHPGPSLHNDRYVKAGAPRASVGVHDPCTRRDGPRRSGRGRGLITAVIRSRPIPERSGGRPLRRSWGRGFEATSAERGLSAGVTARSRAGGAIQ